MVRKGSSSSQRSTKQTGSKAGEARGLLSIVERSQVPLRESANLYAALKSKIDADENLTAEEYAQLQRLVKIAKDWEKGVESSAMTEREETLAG